MREFISSLKHERLQFDGGMGTQLTARGLKAICPEVNNAESIAVVKEIHKDYAAAGAHVISTNTFGATPIKLACHGMGSRSAELSRLGVKIAKEGAPDAFVALDAGPTGAFLAPFGPLTLTAMTEAYRVQFTAGAEESPDLILLETFGDIGEMRAAAFAAKETGLPVGASFTFERNGFMLMGGAPECAAMILTALGVDFIGINCGSGPEDMLPILKKMRALTPLPILCQPNAGIPYVENGATIFPYSPEQMSPLMQPLLDAGANHIGGCCGTTPAHIALMSKLPRQTLRECPAPGGKYIASSRRYVPVGTLSHIEAVDDADGIYEVDDSAQAALINLAGLSPMDAMTLICEAQSVLKMPLIIKASDTGSLICALHNYQGIAGVDAGNLSGIDEIMKQYGAVRL